MDTQTSSLDMPGVSGTWLAVSVLAAALVWLYAWAIQNQQTLLPTATWTSAVEATPAAAVNAQPLDTPVDAVASGEMARESITPPETESASMSATQADQAPDVQTPEVLEGVADSAEAQRTAQAGSAASLAELSMAWEATQEKRDTEKLSSPGQVDDTTVSLRSTALPGTAEQGPDASADALDGNLTDATEPGSLASLEIWPYAEDLQRSKETLFERQRREELYKLEALAADVRFPRNASITNDNTRKALDPIFESLYLYSESDVQIIVASGDLDTDSANRALSMRRASAIVGYLINRGLDAARFKIRVSDSSGLLSGEHRVRVLAIPVN